MCCQQFLGIVSQIEQLRMQAPGGRFVLNQLPVTPPDASHAWLLTAAVNAIERVTNRLLPACQHRQKARAFIGLRWLDARDVAERGSVSPR